MNITDLLTEHARDRADHPAIEDGQRVVTYGALDREINAMAGNLQGVGIERGDIVAVLLDDSADHLVLVCALARIGAVIFSLNPKLPRREIGEAMKDLSVKAIVAAPKTKPFAGREVLSLDDLRQTLTKPFSGSATGGDLPVMLNQSSGTTGAPKSFLHSHTEMLAWMARNTKVQGWSQDERFLCLSSMCFTDCRNISLCILRLGATVVIQRCRSMEELAAFVRDKRVSYLKLTPSHLVPMLEYAAGKKLLFPDLRLMVVASAPVTHPQRLAARQQLTPNFCEQLGSNETGPLVFGNPADQDLYPDAVGRVVEGVEAQIVDEKDKPVPPGKTGKVRYRGAGYPTAYLNDPDASARAFRDGWFYPGDIAALNEQGYLFFKGRADDVINNSGVKFYPIEVETALLAHPHVREAAVFSRAHDRQGEVAVACVVASRDVSADDLQAFCAKRIAGYKVPRIVATVPELPKNAMGKVKKDVLKRSFERTLTAKKPQRRVTLTASVDSTAGRARPADRHRES